MIILNIILWTVFIILSASVLYVVLFSVAGKLGTLRKVPPTDVYKKFAVFIPSYKEDAVITESARDALNQDYPKDQYDVIVIADSLKEETIRILKELPVKVVEVSFDLSTKAKSLNVALSTMPAVYDYALVLDADNVMAPNFLRKINASFQHTGVKVIQGHRVAKNLNTNMAILDAMSEEINNHVFRKGHRIMGLSSALIGSGMAFEYVYFRDIMATNTAIGGFDRELELKLLKEGVKMEYVEDALVYDEKVQNTEVFQNQRRRWMSAQLHYFSKYFFQGVQQLLLKGNIDFFDKVFQQFLLPRVLLLMALMTFTGIVAILQFLFLMPISPDTALFMTITCMYICALLVAVPASFYNTKTLSAMLALPKAVFIMFLTLFKLRGANKKFIHTPHSGSHNISSGNV